MGLNEPLKGEIQSAEGTSVTSGDSGPTSVGYRHSGLMPDV